MSERDELDDTARWLLRRKALRERGAGSPAAVRGLPVPTPLPETEKVQSPLFDLEREKAAAATWAQQQLILVTAAEPEPEPEPEIVESEAGEPGLGSRASLQRRTSETDSPATVLATRTPELLVADPWFAAEVAEVLSERQRKDLADIFRVAAGSGETLDITRLRAVLRTIGCERLCTDVLEQLVELRAWNAARGDGVWIGRRPLAQTAT